jgi:hypothetical protein
MTPEYFLGPVFRLFGRMSDGLGAIAPFFKNKNARRPIGMGASSYEFDSDLKAGAGWWIRAETQGRNPLRACQGPPHPTVVQGHYPTGANRFNLLEFQ